MSDNGATDATDLDESWEQFYSTFCNLPEELDELSDRLRALLPSSHGGTLEEAPDDLKEYVSELLTTARDTAEELHDQAETLHERHVYLTSGEADPLSIIQRFDGEYQDDYARQVWQDHRECTVDELESIVRKLSDIQEATRSRIGNEFKAGEQPSERDVNAFVEAYYRRPIINYMAELAALEGPKPPAWEEIRWQKKVSLELRGHDRSQDTLRVLYFLLCQLDRKFESRTELYDSASRILEIQPRSVERNVRRGVQKQTTTELKDLSEHPDTVDDWRRWLEGREGLAITAELSQTSV